MHITCLSGVFRIPVVWHSTSSRSNHPPPGGYPLGHEPEAPTAGEVLSGAGFRVIREVSLDNSRLGAMRVRLPIREQPIQFIVLSLIGSHDSAKIVVVDFQSAANVTQFGASLGNSMCVPQLVNPFKVEECLLLIGGSGGLAVNALDDVIHEPGKRMGSVRLKTTRKLIVIFLEGKLATSRLEFLPELSANPESVSQWGTRNKRCGHYFSLSTE
jgi:hypothetical protein